MTAVEQDQINDGLVTRRNRYSKTIFDTEGDLRRGARQLSGVAEYPNSQVGYGALCVRDSLPV